MVYFPVTFQKRLELYLQYDCHFSDIPRSDSPSSGVLVECRLAAPALGDAAEPPGMCLHRWVSQVTLVSSGIGKLLPHRPFLPLGPTDKHALRTRGAQRF